MTFALPITASTLVSPLGQGLPAHARALQTQQAGLRDELHAFNPKLKSFFGEVDALDSVKLPVALHAYHCRNHQLAWLALQTDGFAEAVAQAVARYGAHRVGVAVGTSTSGILETERALAHKRQHGGFPADYHYEHSHRMNALADFCADALQISGPRVVISTACSSSAKVFATASRWLAHNLVDAVVVGGVDSLCLTTLHGFNALGLVSETPVRPLDANRNGINIGEAGGFMLLEKQPKDPIKIVLSGYGESSDAYHISTPHPAGEGARQAMQQALDRAKLSPFQIDYLNLHGTGTPSNDLSESKAVHRVFGQNLPPHSSTKGFTGHTLGAAGITEAVFCQLALQQQFVPANLNLQQVDAELNLQPVTHTLPAKVQHAMSNSFGFGGNNATLIFSLAEAVQ